MDQAALDVLLKQLQGLDNPDQHPSSFTPESAQSLSRPEEGEVQEIIIEPHHNEYELAQPASEVVADTALPDQSELEKLLGSLIPLNQPSDGVEQTEAPPAEPFGDYSEWLDNDEAPGTTAEYAIPQHLAHLPEDQQDLRKITFTQALPILSHLVTNGGFVEQMQILKSRQEAFELSTIDERNKAKQDLEKQLRQAQIAAQESGSSYEVDRIHKLLASTMAKFDKQALNKWDALALEQQSAMQGLGVPCFYPLKGADPMAAERQRRVLETLLQLINEI